MSGIPDYHFDVVHLVAEGDMVAALDAVLGDAAGTGARSARHRARRPSGEMVFFRITDCKIRGGMGGMGRARNAQATV